jgi:hypothetical protein
MESAKSACDGSDHFIAHGVNLDVHIITDEMRSVCKTVELRFRVGGKRLGCLF